MTWVRGSGDTRPLAVRHREVATEMIAYGETPIVPVSEQSIYDMQILLNRKRPVVVDDEALKNAGREHFNLRCRYQRTVLEIVRLQSGLSHSVGEWVHRLLGDIPPGFNREWPRELPDTAHDATASEVRRAVGEALPRVLAAEALRDALDKALHVNDVEPTALHHRMLAELFARHEQLEATMRDTAAALSARIDELEDVIARIGKRVRSRRKQQESVK
jgi:hypothetical protein